MGQVLSMAALYCFYNAAQSLCVSCFGTTAPGTTGRKRSVLLLGMTIAVSLWFQYTVGPGIVSKNSRIWKIIRSIPFMSANFIYNAWYDSCSQYDDTDNNFTTGEDGDEHEHDFHNDMGMDMLFDDGNNSNDNTLLAQCAGNAGVMRACSLATIYFIGNSVATKIVPTLNREAWPAKYTLFGFMLLISLFIPNSPWFTGIYLWLARFGAAIFVVLQQIILIDVAYNWNDDWVERANEADRLSYGSGSGWLHSIVGVCVAMYSACAVIIGLLYTQFAGCPGNTWVITLTLLGIIAMTAIQLSGTEGSLLTSGVISLYVVYLCFSIVNKNPRGECNPRLGHNDVWGITIGLLLTTVSLVWTGWSWSAEARLNVDAAQSAKSVGPAAAANGTSSGDSGELNLDVPFLQGEEVAPSGIVSSGNDSSSGNESSSLAHVWKLNVVMALISCYVAMILTGWGTVNGLDDNHNAANPTIGRVNMAILGCAQWLVIGLYCWTLLAPKIFPDRDFS
mmetsp:Transcript_25653/g.60723  ORF Transcript_25653/g.60723 Transcript_25653/m.60723 type:complete len:506 (+) Transcript_25653:292-1809(+)